MAQNQRPPLAVPIILITVGALFLYANYRPSFDPWHVLKTYWPLILIFVGLGKMVDSMRQRENPNAPRSSIGLTLGMLGVILVVVVLLLRFAERSPKGNGVLPHLRRNGLYRMNRVRSVLLHHDHRSEPHTV